MTERHVTILGDVRIEEVRDAQGVRERVAGDAVELVRALRDHGVVVTVVTPIGEDADGERIRAVFADVGAQLVGIPAPEGTPRWMIVRDRAGAQSVLRRGGTTSFVETRRSLAAQSEAEHVVDLRETDGSEEDGAAVAERRDAVLRALGLRSEDEGTSRPPAGVPDAPTAASPATEGGGDAPGGASEESSPRESVAGDAAPKASSDTARGRSRLLPAPVVAGTVRHAPVRLTSPGESVRGEAPDLHGLADRIGRIAT